MKMALGRIPASRKWGKVVPGGRSSMSKDTEVESMDQYGSLEGRRRKEGWSTLSANRGAGLLICTVALAFTETW